MKSRTIAAVAAGRRLHAGGAGVAPFARVAPDVGAREPVVVLCFRPWRASALVALLNLLAIFVRVPPVRVPPVLVPPAFLVPVAVPPNKWLRPVTQLVTDKSSSFISWPPAAWAARFVLFWAFTRTMRSSIVIGLLLGDAVGGGEFIGVMVVLVVVDDAACASPTSSFLSAAILSANDGSGVVVGVVVGVSRFTSLPTSLFIDLLSNLPSCLALVDAYLRAKRA